MGKSWSIDACLYFCRNLFLLYVFALLYHLVFLFSLVRFLFSFSFCVFFFLPSFLCLHPLFMATSLPLILLKLMGFFLYVPKTIPTICGFLWASLQDCLLTNWLSGHYLYSKCACHTTLYFQRKFIVLFPSPLLPCFPQMDKDWGLSPPTLMACTKWSQLVFTSFRRNAIPAKHFTERSLSRNPIIDCFSPHL